ncbi:hypothetical protein [Amycolatopsis sp. H20-H5]|uniref:hypothetical protein n=1 Tax=Amycolatopsis sp. H20-H5 TaxID=3046309 RepID=UPI002DBC0654|nr:hypothetical protein [Amycolatopsis sp. H20-H5]MEC3975005.1 hypothetical protein [Amycolatopsis sp. H20-H5]
MKTTRLSPLAYAIELADAPGTTLVVTTGQPHPSNWVEILTELRPHLRKCWNIPPRANAEFAARIEDVLAVYARTHNLISAS